MRYSKAGLVEDIDLVSRRWIRSAATIGYTAEQYIYTTGIVSNISASDGDITSEYSIYDGNFETDEFTITTEYTVEAA